jgi:hypothetical protein
MQRARAACLPIALVTVCTLSAACFTSETVIKVKADGSGTIEQTNLVNGQMVGMVAAMAGAAAKEKDVPSIPDVNPDQLFSEEQFRAQAAQWGVRFVSHTPLEKGAMKGAAAVFAFDDVNTLAFGIRTSGQGAQVPAGPPMRFKLTTVGGRSALSVTFPEDGPADRSAPAAPAPSTPATAPQIPPEALAMVKSMFAGAHMGVAVEVDGRIVASNAPAVTDSRATLVEFDFAELLSDASQISALQSLKPGVDFATVRKTLDGVKGVKFPSQAVVNIEFAK